MTPQEIHKLLGGYATGTLTHAEREALFAAALQDQALFDALAKEQPLHDLLREPAARAHLLAALDRPKRAWWGRWQWALAGSLAAASLVIATAVYLRPKPVVIQSDSVAKVERQSPAPAATVAEAPRPEPVPPPAPAARKRVAAAPAHHAASPQRAEVRQLDKTESIATLAPLPAPPAARDAKPTAQTVEATAAPAVPNTDQNAISMSGAVGGVLPPQNARALFYSAPGLAQSQFVPRQEAAGAQFSAQLGVQTVKGAMWVRNLGVKWTALRRQPDGLFSEVDPEQIHAGDVIKLRLVPNDDGFLSVAEGPRVMMPQRPVRRLDPLDTPEITGPVGRKDLTIVLSRQQQWGLAAGSGGGDAGTQRLKQAQPATLVRAAAAADQLSEADRKEHAVYEVKTGNNPLAPVLVKVPLIFK